MHNSVYEVNMNTALTMNGYKSTGFVVRYNKNMIRNERYTQLERKFGHKGYICFAKMWF